MFYDGLSFYDWMGLFLCRDNGVKAIENLMLKRGKFDYILLETTGLADPGKLVLVLLLDPGLAYR